MNEETIRAAIAYVQALFAGNADGHDAEHTLRVYRNAMKIAEREDCDRGIVALAALLHDVDDHKLFHTEDNANARAFLRAHKVDESTAGQIIAAVNAVSFSQNRGRGDRAGRGPAGRPGRCRGRQDLCLRRQAWPGPFGFHPPFP